MDTYSCGRLYNVEEYETDYKTETFFFNAQYCILVIIVTWTLNKVSILVFKVAGIGYYS